MQLADGLNSQVADVVADFISGLLPRQSLVSPGKFLTRRSQRISSILPPPALLPAYWGWFRGGLATASPVFWDVSCSWRCVCTLIGSWLLIRLRSPMVYQARALLIAWCSRFVALPPMWCRSALHRGNMYQFVTAAATNQKANICKGYHRHCSVVELEFTAAAERPVLLQ